MDNKKVINLIFTIFFFFCIGGLLIFCITIVVGIYVYNLWGNGISDDPEQWGQFGDYFGGVLNPILTIFNLILVVYLTFKISYLEKNRNKSLLAENVRPLGLFSFELSKNTLKVNLHNVGLGPLIIKEFKTYCIHENKEIADFYELICDLKIKNFIPAYSGRKNSDENIIAKDSYMKILELSVGIDSQDPNYSDMLKSFNKIKDEIIKYEFKVTYTDIYGKLIESKIENLEQLKVKILH
ncbi:hypothetical protein [uncultured Chryseobacterium sp.]|uniref:hypothetical protein n=1 Tax=uncultured Chryseobacterium sp. TaxID=259322 RepID=UPI00374A0E0D